MVVVVVVVVVVVDVVVVDAVVELSAPEVVGFVPADAPDVPSGEQAVATRESAAIRMRSRTGRGRPICMKVEATGRSRLCR